MTANKDLNAFFYPDTVAVIGASATPGKVGHTLVANMIRAGFHGKLLPVNPKGGEIEGLPVTTDITDLPRGLDLGVISVPPQYVVRLLRLWVGSVPSPLLSSLPGSRKSARTDTTWSRTLSRRARNMTWLCSVPIAWA